MASRVDVNINFRWLLELMSTSLSFPVVFSMFISGRVGRVLNSLVVVLF
jgi:hypothetical protein